MKEKVTDKEKERIRGRKGEEKEYRMKERKTKKARKTERENK